MYSEKQEIGNGAMASWPPHCLVWQFDSRRICIWQAARPSGCNLCRTVSFSFRERKGICQYATAAKAHRVCEWSLLRGLSGSSNLKTQQANFFFFARFEWPRTNCSVVEGFTPKTHIYFFFFIIACFTNAVSQKLPFVKRWGFLFIF